MENASRKAMSPIWKVEVAKSGIRWRDLIANPKSGLPGMVDGSPEREFVTWMSKSGFRHIFLFIDEAEPLES